MSKPQFSWLLKQVTDYLIMEFGDNVMVSHENHFFLFYNEKKGFWEIDMNENIVNNTMMEYLYTHCYKSLESGGWGIFEHTDKDIDNPRISLNDIITNDSQYKTIIKKFNRIVAYKRLVNIDDMYTHSCQREIEVGKNTKELIFINVKNGVLRIDPETNETFLTDHSKEHHFLARIEVNYKPTAVAPTWKKFLKSVVETKSDVDLIRLYMAYTLLSHDFDWEAALYVYGEGANGKGTLLRAFTTMFSNPTHTAISSLDNQFGATSLINANFWWANESDQKIINTEFLKRMITGEKVQIDIKYGQPEEHIFNCKLIVTANEIPLLKKYADKRRFIVVRFPHKFEGSDKDVNLDEKLEEELEGLLNWIIGAIPHYLENAGPLSAGISERYEEQYEQLSDPFRLFLDSFVMETANFEDEISSKELAMAFNAFAKKHNHDTYTTAIVSKRTNAFFDHIKDTYLYVTEEVVDNDGNVKQVEKKLRGYAGLKLDRQEIYGINPMWDNESLNKAHIPKSRRYNKISEINKDATVKRLQFVNKIQANAENGIDLDTLAEIGKNDGLTKSEVRNIVNQLKSDGNLQEIEREVYKVVH